MGQVPCLSSQVSMHAEWKEWLQPGSWRNRSPSSYSLRQTAHSLQKPKTLECQKAYRDSAILACIRIEDALCAEVRISSGRK
jgi:hypothetical protein